MHAALAANNYPWFLQEVIHNDVPTLPVYCWTRAKPHFSVEELARILLTKSVPSSQICSEQPCYVQKNVAFAVDLHKLKDPRDIRADENGTWVRKGSPVAYAFMKMKELLRFFDGKKWGIILIISYILSSFKFT